MKPEIRNSLPAPLVWLQGWLESERLLHQLLSLPNNSTVRILHIRRNFKFRKLIVESENTRYVVYSHHWPSGLRRMSAHLRIAQDHGVGLPSVLQEATDWRALRSVHCFALVLPYVQGQALNSTSDLTQLYALGSNLGKLHGIRGARRGQLIRNLPSTGNYWQGQQRYWQQTAKQLHRHSQFATGQAIDATMRWLHEHGQGLQDIHSLSLTHGDPSSGNFLIQPDGQLCMIDCDRLGFDLGPAELANALLQGYCAGQPQRQLALIDGYLRDCPSDLKTLWEHRARFFIANALLWRCQRKLQWSHKRPTAGHSSARSALAWQQLQTLIHTPAVDTASMLALLAD